MKNISRYLYKEFIIPIFIIFKWLLMILGLILLFYLLLLIIDKRGSCNSAGGAWLDNESRCIGTYQERLEKCAEFGGIWEKRGGDGVGSGLMTCKNSPEWDAWDQELDQLIADEKARDKR